jgi:cell division septum initiation protein DivIVA
MNVNWKNARLLCAPDGGDGGGEDEEAQREAGFQRLADRYNNDGVSMAKELYRENYQVRRKNATLQAELTEAKNRVPAEGSIVLTSEQAQQWAAYQALGTPETVKSAVEERGQLQGRLDTLAREDVLRKAAEATGFVFDVLKDADALATRVGGKTLTYDVRETERDGTKVPVAFVKDGDAEKPLSEFAQENWANLMPSLAVKQDTGAQRQGTFYPPQHQGSGGGGPKTAKQATEATLNKSYASRDKQT